jgi:hypothetical protein
LACIGDARPLDEIADLLETAGLVVEQTEAHDDALASVLDRIEARLKVAAMLAVDFAIARELLHDVRGALDRGLLGYGIVVAHRP